ncbi:PIN domain-like protein [Macrolepiota fuliginosa MF-IS2]|uniref:PIN domain-like protein n=1 Tax=Macrolepiota fuliginosa MF-IS2 TaxID=1400762 RepID=A0A9P6C0C5_9AGAR|nr:PIN domain-like protein [Macrolepiota fuliginosa MF-IS2]
MGVHGLTTYLRENTRSLSNAIRFPLASGDVAPIVVDGWSFIYNLYQESKLPWVYGGEYPEFSLLIARVVQAWIQLGLKIYFVFDGACPDLKFPTVITRLGQSHVQPGLLFFRTSATSRSAPRFLHETRILPPLSYTACVHALEELAKNNDKLEIHYADEEGDPYSVELAGRVGGYVLGNDSDFVILNAPGYLGYIPLDDMVWESTALDQSSLVDDDPGDDFQKVSKPKSKKKWEGNIGRSIIPPDGAQDIHLSCTVYHPDILASHLNLPVTLLPLLGALVGNDFTAHSEADRRSIQSLFFERRLSVVQRIETATSTMRKILSPTLPKKKTKHQVGSVMDLIDRTVNSLLSRLNTPLSSGEVDAVVDKVVTATLQYAITKHEGSAALWPTDICALHDPDLCPILPLMSRRVLEESEGVDGQTHALIQSADIRHRYVQAYRSGYFSPKLMDILSTGTSWPRLFLETPDLETVSRSIARPLRTWVYSILDDSLGLPIDESDHNHTDAATEDLTHGEIQIEEVTDGDEDELVDVVESDSEEERVDFLAPLKGALRRLHSSDDDATETDAPLSVVSQRSNRVGSPKVAEYVRRGTRIAAEVLSVTPLDELLSSISCSAANGEPDGDETISLVQKSPEERFTVLLRALESDLPIIRRLSPEQLQPVLSVRWIARCLHQRALETGSRDREKEKWSSHEARCVLAVFASWKSNVDAAVGNEYPPIHDRNVQLSAQLLTTLEAVEHLSQSLLLASHAPSVSHRFSGRLFHSYLSGNLTLPYNGAVTEMWEACREDLVENFREDHVKKEKKLRKGGDTTTAPRQKVKARLQGGFSLLAGLDV